MYVISIQGEAKAYQTFIGVSLIPLLLLSIILSLTYSLFPLLDRQSILVFEERDPCLK